MWSDQRVHILVEMEKDANHLGKIGLGVGDILTKDPFKRTDRGRASDLRDKSQTNSVTKQRRFEAQEEAY